MAIVRIDDKGRIQLPKQLRTEMRLKAHEPLVARKQGEHILMTRAADLNPANDPLLNDILVHPLHSKVKVTKKLLEKLEEEQWSE